MTYAHEARCSADSTNPLGLQLNKKLHKAGGIRFGAWQLCEMLARLRPGFVSFQFCSKTRLCEYS